MELLAAAAVFLLAFQGRRAPQQDEQQQQPPGGAGGLDPGKTLGALGALAGNVVSVATAVAGLGGTGGGTAAIGGAAGAKTGATVAGAGTSTVAIGGLVVEAIGGSLFIVGIVAAVALVMVADAVREYRNAQMQFLRRFGIRGAQWFFEAIVSEVSRRESVGSMRIDSLPPAQIRKLVLTSLYLNYRALEVDNNALVAFYRANGWSDAQMAQAGVDLPVVGVFPDYWASVAHRYNAPASSGGGRHNEAYLASASLWTRALSSATGGLEASQPGYAEITAPVTSVAMMRTAALEVLQQAGAAGLNLLRQVEFMGRLGALAFMSVQGYGGPFGYPGDEQFTRTLAATVGWPVHYGLRLVGPEERQRAVTAWWATDPQTGHAFDVAGVRAWQANISVRQA